jgi:hypothetical protein
MRRRTLLLSITPVGIAGTAAFGWVTIRRGFSARDNPSGIEKLVAATARQLAVPSQYRQLRNPLSHSSDNLRAGMEHFADHSATCHAAMEVATPHSAKVSNPTTGRAQEGNTKQERWRALLHD